MKREAADDALIAVSGAMGAVGSPGLPLHKPAAWATRVVAIKAAVVCALVLIILLRLVALRSDPYPGLDWSTGLMTDEGFYIHNARNLALFGHPRTDQFNNMLLSPLLNVAQTALFTLVGVGSLQARLLSVLTGLLTLLLFFAALRRAFGTRLALLATLLLGLDHPFLLYNRMALMDTPATLSAVACLYAFVRGVQTSERRRQGVWLLACGALLGLTLVSRMLLVYLLAAPWVGLWWARARREAYGWMGLGLGFVLTAYLLGWYLPHHAEIAAMNHYYRTQQIQPGSLARFGVDLFNAFLGDSRGLLPFLVRHTPVLFVLALLWMGGLALRRFIPSPHGGEDRVPQVREGQGQGEGRVSQPRNGQGASSPTTSHAQTAVIAFLTAWLLAGWSLLALINYSPSRYYLSAFPPLATLAALALLHPAAWIAGWRDAAPRARAIAALLLLAPLAYQAIEVLWLHAADLLLVVSTLSAVGVACWAGLCGLRGGRRPQRIGVWIAVWALVNGLWLGDWLRGISYTQYDLSRWLGERLPAGSVVVGDVAPGLCLDNGLVAVNVIPGLCNGERPLEHFVGHPRYVAILDADKKERYWVQTYPQTVAGSHLLKQERVLKWIVGIYAVDSSAKG